MEQRRQGTLEIWAEPFTALRVPKLFNLRMDLYERADITLKMYWYWDWYLSKHDHGRAGGRAAVPRNLQGLPAAT